MLCVGTNKTVEGAVASIVGQAVAVLLLLYIGECVHWVCVVIRMYGRFPHSTPNFSVSSRCCPTYISLA